MNERIKELAEQAGAKVSTIGGIFIDKRNIDLEKFAELIVRESSKFCGHDAAGVKALYEHFGIGELFNKDFGVEE